MAEMKTAKTRKVAVIQLDRPEGLESVEDGGEAEIENWPEDGMDNIIPIGKPVQVSVHLAERLRRAGRIKTYSIQTVTE